MNLTNNLKKSKGQIKILSGLDTSFIFINISRAIFLTKKGKTIFFLVDLQLFK